MEELTTDKFWVAAYTRPRSEKKVRTEFTKLGIKTYVPIQKQIRQWTDRKKIIDVVVIPMIIFAYIGENNINIVKNNPLIINILSMPGSKSITHIPDKQIERLQFILGQSDYTVEFETGLFSIRDNVRIIRGNLCGVCGEVMNVYDNKALIVVKIDGLGGAKLTVNKQDLEKI